MDVDLGGAFCLVCGDPPPLFTDGMCESCSRARTHLVEAPANIPWTRCARCGAIEVDGRWGSIEEEVLYDDLVQRHVRVHQDAQEVAGSVSSVDDARTNLEKIFNTANDTVSGIATHV